MLCLHLSTTVVLIKNKRFNFSLENFSSTKLMQINLIPRAKRCAGNEVEYEYEYHVKSHIFRRIFFSSVVLFIQHLALLTDYGHLKYGIRVFLVVPDPLFIMLWAITDFVISAVSEKSHWLNYKLFDTKFLS